MIDGKTSEAFSGMSLPPEAEEETKVRAKVVAFNRLAYGWSRLLVEETIKRQLA